MQPAFLPMQTRTLDSSVVHLGLAKPIIKKGIKTLSNAMKTSVDQPNVGSRPDVK